MIQPVLVDAGPLVAVLHSNDHDHEVCVNALKRLQGPLISTWIPIAEAMYLLDFSLRAQEALLEMIERGALHIVPLEAEDLPAVRALMKKYRDLAMDFADATLVHVANREGINQIFTLDHDFDVYRLRRRRAFHIVPEGSSRR